MQHTEYTVCESLSESNDAKLSEKHIDSVSCSTLMDSVSKDTNLSENSCDQMEHNAVHSAEMAMDSGGGDVALHYSDLHSKINVSSAEMAMGSGGGDVALHYSDLHSKINVSLAEMAMGSGGGDVALHYSDLHLKINVSPVQMAMDSGSGDVALHYSDLYSHKGDHCAEMDSGGGNVALHYSDLYSHKGDHCAEMDSGGGDVALQYSDLYSHKADHSAEMDSGGGNICDTKEGDGFLHPAAEDTESNSENEESSLEDSVSYTQEKMSESNEDQPEDLSVGGKHKHSSCFTAVQDTHRNAQSHNCRSEGPRVLLGRSTYFVALYKQVYTLTAIAERYHYDLRFIESEVEAIERWDILEKKQLECMKSKLEIMLGDKNVEPELASDLTDSDEEKGNSETDGNSSSSSSIREIVYDANVCESYIKPKQLPPISGILTNPPQHLPNEGANVLRNVPQGIVIQSRLASDKSSIGTSHRYQHGDSSAASLVQRLQVASTTQQCSRFGSPATFEQRCGVVTTLETIQKLATSSMWKFNLPLSGAPQHHLGSMLIDVPEKNQQIKLEVHKQTVGQIVSV